MEIDNPATVATNAKAGMGIAGLAAPVSRSYEITGTIMTKSVCLRQEGLTKSRKKFQQSQALWRVAASPFARSESSCGYKRKPARHGAQARCFPTGKRRAASG